MHQGQEKGRTLPARERDTSVPTPFWVILSRRSQATPFCDLSWRERWPENMFYAAVVYHHCHEKSFLFSHSQTTCRATFLERNPYIYILWKTNNNTRYHSFDVIITAPPNFCVRKYARVVWRSGDPIWCKALYIRLYVILVRRVYTSYNLKMSVQLSWPFCSVSFHADRAFCACTVHKLDFYSLRRIIDYVLYDVRSA